MLKKEKNRPPDGSSFRPRPTKEEFKAKTRESLGLGVHGVGLMNFSAIHIIASEEVFSKLEPPNLANAALVNTEWRDLVGAYMRY